MGVKSYKDLIVWQKAIELVLAVYQHTTAFPKDEIYGLRQQLRRAAVSIPSNIAEGQCRSTTKDFLHFLVMARGSLGEVETQVLISQRFAYFNEKQTNDLFARINEVGRLINGLKNSLTEGNASH
jgi:four helix bundle protein